MTRSLMVLVMFILSCVAFGQQKFEGEITFIGYITEGSCVEKVSQKITKKTEYHFANEIFDDCDLDKINGISYPKATIKRYIPKTERQQGSAKEKANYADRHKSHTSPQANSLFKEQLANVLDSSDRSIEKTTTPQKRDKTYNNQKLPLIYIAEYK